MSPSSSHNSPLTVTTLEQFKDLLGDDFAIFCGSGVSGPDPDRPDRFLPMVGDVTEEFFRILSNRLHGGSYLERVVANYADLLVNGKYRHIRVETKFEEFILRLEEVLGAEQVKAFLRALFLCEDGQFTANHAAIAHLLRGRKAAACLTTNFDNAIEQAFPAVQVYAGGDHPASLEGEPCLLKLHGDVLRGSYVATTFELYSAEAERRYEFIERLLSGKAILVIGYSGFGDVDIAPHLTALKGVKLIWVVRSGKAPDFSTHEARFDLAAADPGRNWLLGLAARHGWAAAKGSNAPNWKARMAEWFEGVPRGALYKIVSKVFAWKAGWPVIHMVRVKNWSDEEAASVRSPESYWEEGFAHLQTANYIPAERAFVKAAGSLGREPKFIRWMGYAQWRSGRLRRALNTLAPLALNPPPSSPQGQLVAESMRTYLEVSRDLIRAARKLSERRRLYDELSLDKVIANLSVMRQTSVESDLWSRAIILDIRFQTEASVNTDELQAIYSRARDLRLLTAAQTVACVFITINYEAGREALTEIKHIIRRSMDNAHPVRKAVVAELYAKLYNRTHLRLPAVFDLLDGRLAAKPWAIWINLTYKRKLKMWREALSRDAVIAE